MTRVVCFGLMSLAAGAQDRPAVKPAMVEGQVISDLDQAPLRRAHVTLRPMEAGLTAIGADGDDRGKFVIRDIAPGRYRLYAERDGYLPSTTSLRGALRMPQIVSIRSGTRISNLTFRLRPWAVISGHIRYEDAEPAVRVRVEAYREYRYKGRSGYAVAASTVTDDRGEYRLHALQPGGYVIAAVYERAAPQRGYIEQPPIDDDGREVRVLSYTTTFFPNTVKLGEAVPVRVEYGKEVPGIDLFLNRIQRVKIRGRVRSGLSGVALTTGTITLQRVDSHAVAGLSAPVQPRFDAQGNFEIRDVTPGSYVITADGVEGGKRLVGRATLTVPEDDVENLELMAAPERAWSGKIRIEGGRELDPNQSFMVTLEPRAEGSANVRASVRGDRFDCVVVADDLYDVYVQNLPADFYISSVRANGTDVMGQGLDGRLASGDNPFEIVLDSRGGRVGGVVIGPQGDAWSGANLMLIPDPPDGRFQSYRDAVADEYARFQIRGVAPGNYLLVAWLDDPPCDLYDRDALDSCRAVGMAVVVAPSAEQNVMFNVKARQ